MAKSFYNKKALRRIEELQHQTMMNAMTHGVMAAKARANVETTSMARSIRLNEAIVSRYRNYYGYTAGGVDYNTPLRPVYYSFFQEELFTPFMEPSLQDVVNIFNGKTKITALFKGDGEGLL